MTNQKQFKFQTQRNKLVVKYFNQNFFPKRIKKSYKKHIRIIAYFKVMFGVSKIRYLLHPNQKRLSFSSSPKRLLYYIKFFENRIDRIFILSGFILPGITAIQECIKNKFIKHNNRIITNPSTIVQVNDLVAVKPLVYNLFQKWLVLKKLSFYRYRFLYSYHSKSKFFFQALLTVRAAPLHLLVDYSRCIIIITDILRHTPKVFRKHVNQLLLLLYFAC